jgi:phenylacetate-CoA ligase
MFNLNQLKTLYYNSPLWMKRLYASIPYDIRQGGDYRRWKHFLNTKINAEEYQLLKLKESVHYAYTHTPYYKKLFDTMGLSPFDVNEIADFQKIPLVDKEILRQEYANFIVTDNPKQKSFYVTTGGTSGSPMKLLQSENMWAKEVAFVESFFRQHGYKPKMLKASFRGGDLIVLPPEKLWSFNPVNNEINFSSSFINQETVSQYVQELNRQGPLFIHGLPSLLLFLAHHMKMKGLSLNYRLTAIFLVSEGFSSSDIKEISEFFHCSVASFYGHSERLIFARSIGPVLDGYEIDKRYGFFELLDEENRVIEKNNEKGEIIGSNFDNLAMPLLRFKTGDFTQYKEIKRGDIELVESTRNQEYIDCLHGNKLSFSTFVRASEMQECNVFKYQIWQKSPGECTLRIVPNSEFKASCKTKLLKTLNKRAMGELNIEIETVGDLERTARGKLKLILKAYQPFVSEED